MYTVKCDGYPLLDVRDDELILVNPKVKVEVNTVGEGSFTIYKNHPNYNRLKMKKSVFEVADEIGVIFRGRMTEYTRDFANGKAVDLEGAMAFFNDSIVAPYNFPEDFLEDAEYIEASESGNVVEFFLNWLIENHNSQVQPFQRFRIGIVTVFDPNNYITRSESGTPNTWETLKSKLFNSSLGGFLVIRYEADGNYIDYLSEFTVYNAQDIEFGENLLDIKHRSDASTTYSAIIPTSAETTTKEKLSLESIADGAITEDIYKITLPNGLHALYSKSAVDEYGWVCAPVKDTTWNDVTEVQNLLTKSINWMITQGMMLTDTVEITAVDLHFSDEQIRSFRIYRKLNVSTKPHGIESSYDLTKLDIDLLNPQNTKITVGETKLTLTDQANKKQSENVEKIEEAFKDIEESRSEISEVKNQLMIQSTTLINTCNEIILSALSSYVETSDYETYKETIESQFKLLSDEMTLRFSETFQQIANVNGDLQEKYNTITKYFTFDVNGLTIGQVDSPYKVVIDNDRYSMLVNGIEVLWLANGIVHTPEIEVTRALKLFGYLIDQDSAGNVNLEYVGGE